MYSKEILDRLANPKNVGKVKKADASFILSEPQATIRIYIKVDKNVITDAKFKAFGCAVVIAGLDATMDLIKNRQVDDVLNLKKEDIFNALSEVPEQKEHYLGLILDALKGTVKTYHKKQGKMEVLNGKEKKEEPPKPTGKLHRIGLGIFRRRPKTQETPNEKKVEEVPKVEEVKNAIPKVEPPKENKVLSGSDLILKGLDVSVPTPKETAEGSQVKPEETKVKLHRRGRPRKNPVKVEEPAKIEKPAEVEKPVKVEKRHRGRPPKVAKKEEIVKVVEPTKVEKQAKNIAEISQPATAKEETKAKGSHRGRPSKVAKKEEEIAKVEESAKVEKPAEVEKRHRGRPPKVAKKQEIAKVVEPTKVGEQVKVTQPAEVEKSDGGRKASKVAEKKEVAKVEAEKSDKPKKEVSKLPGRQRKVAKQARVEHKSKMEWPIKVEKPSKVEKVDKDKKTSKKFDTTKKVFKAKAESKSKVHKSRKLKKETYEDADEDTTQLGIPILPEVEALLQNTQSMSETEEDKDSNSGNADKLLRVSSKVSKRSYRGNKKAKKSK